MQNGEMLGESRLMMEESSLKHGPAPVRSATVVASGHVVLLAISTEMARECFRGDVLVQLRGLGQKRQHMLQATSPEWVTTKLQSRNMNPQAPEEIDSLQVDCHHRRCTTCSSTVLLRWPSSETSGMNPQPSSCVLSLISNVSCVLHQISKTEEMLQEGGSVAQRPCAALCAGFSGTVGEHAPRPSPSPDAGERTGGRTVRPDQSNC
jgi:hypothetical protein